MCITLWGLTWHARWLGGIQARLLRKGSRPFTYFLHRIFSVSKTRSRSSITFLITGFMSPSVCNYCVRALDASLKRFRLRRLGNSRIVRVFLSWRTYRLVSAGSEGNVGRCLRGEFRARWWISPGWHPDTASCRTLVGDENFQLKNVRVELSLSTNSRPADALGWVRLERWPSFPTAITAASDICASGAGSASTIKS